MKKHKKPLSIPQEKLFPSLPAQVVENLYRMGWYVQSEMASFFKPYKLTPQQFNTMRILTNKEIEKTGLPTLELMYYLIQKLPDITRLINHLEKLQYVERYRIANDRRVVMVRITAKGKKLVNFLETPIIKTAEERLKHYSKEELVDFNNLLIKLMNS